MNPASITIDPSEPTVLALAVAVLAAAGGVGLLAGFYFYLQDQWRGQLSEAFEFDGRRSIHEGAVLPDYVDEESLRTLVGYHKLEESPSSVEESSSGGHSWSLPKGVLSGRREDESKVTREPHDATGELIRRLVYHLDMADELNQNVDSAYVEDILVESIPNFAVPDDAQRALESWFAEQYPQGFDGAAPAEIAGRLARIGHEVPRKELCARLKKSFAVLADEQGSALYLDGEWEVEEQQDGSYLLRRTDLRIFAGAARQIERSIPMPAGVSITAHLEGAGALTKLGKNRMVGVTRPIRASVLATVRQYRPEVGCFEVAAIAVYQRVGSDRDKRST